MSVLLIVRLTVAAGLLVVVGAAGRARAPRRPASPRELRRLLESALGLYAVGVLAWLAHRALLATLVLAGGVVAAALAGWLSRGAFPEDPPDDAPDGTGPAAPPDGLDPIDWDRFDRERRAWTSSTRSPDRPAAPR